MDRAKTAIIHRLSPRMSIVHPWMICFDLSMPHEVFDPLNKEILGLTIRARTWRWSTSQIPVDFDFWLVDLAHLLAILAS